MRETDSLWANTFDENKEAQAFIEANSDGTLFHATQKEKDDFMLNISTFGENQEFYQQVHKSPTLLGFKAGQTDATKIAGLAVDAKEESVAFCAQYGFESFAIHAGELDIRPYAKSMFLTTKTIESGSG